MPDTTITCPNAACARPLALPEGAAGKPLSCPYCRSEIKVELDPAGAVAIVAVARRGGLRIPKQLLVPGFSLLIIGIAALVINGYIGWRCLREPGFDHEYARRRVADLRDGTAMPGRKDKPPTDVTPQDLFGAVAGGPGAAAMIAEADEALATAWAPYIAPLQAVFVGLSVLTALGGLCVLLGRGYWLAFLGCAAAVLNLNNACCVPGAVAGLWGVLMLVRDEGRRYFRIAPAVG